MHDVIIIGSGPAGYVAAERAGEMGRSVLLVERGEHLGGVCLNCGCIPTKSMLYSAKTYHHAVHGGAFGVHVEGARFAYPEVKARTEGIQDTLRGGIRGLMKKNKVVVVQGTARITARDTVEVDGTAYRGAHILVCTGSEAFVPPIQGLRGNPLAVTNRGILAQEEMADHLVVIGAGVIGTEFAALYSMAGKRVTVIEMLDKICGSMETELSRTLQKHMEKQGVTFHLGATVTQTDGGTVTFTDKKGAAQSVTGDLLLVATGRSVNTADLGLEDLGVDFDRRGIRVDERGRTNVPGIWAAGDVTGRWQLAHFASRQATVAIRNMFGGDEICREDAVPAVVYTDPEMSSVGLTPEGAQAQGRTVKTHKFNLAANGRYLAETDGMRGLVKVVTDAATGAILGLHILAPGSSEMIAAGAVMIEAELRVQDLKEVIFPHPCIAEAIHDAVME